MEGFLRHNQRFDMAGGCTGTYFSDKPVTKGLQEVPLPGNINLATKRIMGAYFLDGTCHLLGVFYRPTVTEVHRFSLSTFSWTRIGNSGYVHGAIVAEKKVVVQDRKAYWLTFKHDSLNLTVMTLDDDRMMDLGIPDLLPEYELCLGLHKVALVHVMEPDRRGSWVNEVGGWTEKHWTLGLKNLIRFEGFNPSGTWWSGLLVVVLVGDGSFQLFTVSPEDKCAIYSSRKIDLCYYTESL